MKIYHLPQTVKTIIFDIDSTLYTHSEYAAEQVDIQIRHLSGLRGESADATRKIIDDFRVAWKLRTGETISLGNTLIHFGIPISESIAWRETLIEPADFLTADALLRETLLHLAKSYQLIAVTNNPVLPARKTVQALGVSDLFAEIIGLDTCGVSKPHRSPFLLAAERTATRPEHCLSVGDRFDIDIALPLELGMGGILVDGVQDVYKLPEIL